MTSAFLLDGLVAALSPANLGWGLAGVTLGTAVGVLPGIGPALTVALLLPVTYGLDPTAAFIMFAGIYYGAMYGGSTTSILLNTPGESATIVTALEGNRMARSGRAGPALATAAIGSFVAGTIGTLAITFLAPLVVELALQFGPADYFSLIVLAFVTVSAVLGASAVRGLTALLLGIWWKRGSGEGALAGMIAGLVVCLYYMLAPHYIPFAFYESSSFLSNATTEAASHYETLRQSYYLADEAGRAAALAEWEEAARPLANWFGVSGDFAGLFAVPVGFLAMIGVSLFTPAPSREVQSFVEDLRKPQAA